MDLQDSSLHDLWIQELHALSLGLVNLFTFTKDSCEASPCQNSAFEAISWISCPSNVMLATRSFARTGWSDGHGKNASIFTTKFTSRVPLGYFPSGPLRVPEEHFSYTSHNCTRAEENSVQVRAAYDLWFVGAEGFYSWYLLDLFLPNVRQSKPGWVRVGGFEYIIAAGDPLPDMWSRSATKGQWGPPEANSGMSVVFASNIFIHFESHMKKLIQDRKQLQIIETSNPRLFTSKIWSCLSMQLKDPNITWDRHFRENCTRSSPSKTGPRRGTMVREMGIGYWLKIWCWCLVVHVWFAKMSEACLFMYIGQSSLFVDEVLPWSPISIPRRCPVAGCKEKCLGSLWHVLFLTLQSLETSTVFCFSVFFKANLVVLVDACRLPFLLCFFVLQKGVFFCVSYGLSSRGVEKPDFRDFSNTFPANSPSIHVLSQLWGWAHPTSLIVKNVARQCVCDIDTKRSTIAGDGGSRGDECMMFDSRCSKDLFWRELVYCLWFSLDPATS